MISQLFTGSRRNVKLKMSRDRNGKPAESSTTTAVALIRAERIPVTRRAAVR